MNAKVDWVNPIYIELHCEEPTCPHAATEQYTGFSQARRFAREHVKHTGHKVWVTRQESVCYGPEE